MNQIIILLAAAALTLPFGASAQDAKKGEAAAKSAGCLKCHSPSAEKDGPSFKASSAKYKGQAAGLEKFIAGHETGKKAGGQIKDIAAYILSR